MFKERGEIYLNGHGKVSAEAIAGRPHGVYVLAAILAHEMAHVQGLDERGRPRGRTALGLSSS